MRMLAYKILNQLKHDYKAFIAQVQLDLIKYKCVCVYIYIKQDKRNMLKFAK